MKITIKLSELTLVGGRNQYQGKRTKNQDAKNQRKNTKEN